MQNMTPSSADPNKEEPTQEKQDVKCGEAQEKRADEALDEAIEESFPASDPVSMVVDGPRVQPKECDFRPSDQHPETDHVAHPEKDTVAAGQSEERTSANAEGDPTGTARPQNTEQNRQTR